jgi:hypothetical protein
MLPAPLKAYFHLAAAAFFAISLRCSFVVLRIRPAAPALPLRIRPLVRRDIFGFAGRDLGNHDGTANDICQSFLTLRTLWHITFVYCLTRHGCNLPFATLNIERSEILLLRQVAPNRATATYRNHQLRRFKETRTN